MPLVYRTCYKIYFPGILYCIVYVWRKHVRWKVRSTKVIPGRDYPIVTAYRHLSVRPSRYCQYIRNRYTEANRTLKLIRFIYLITLVGFFWADMTGWQSRLCPQVASRPITKEPTMAINLRSMGRLHMSHLNDCCSNIESGNQIVNINSTRKAIVPPPNCIYKQTIIVVAFQFCLEVTWTRMRVCVSLRRFLYFFPHCVRCHTRESRRKTQAPR